jgi:hypothetical protein
VAKYTANYGANSSQRNELGQRLPEKRIWTRKEDFSGAARGAFDFETRLDLASMIAEFVALHGRKPSQLHVEGLARGAKCLAKSYPEIGFVSLDIIHNAVETHLQ